MKVTKIKIDSLYGVHHLELNGNPVEITGKKGTGKTSVIDSIKYALSNRLIDRQHKNMATKDLSHDNDIKDRMLSTSSN